MNEYTSQPDLYAVIMAGGSGTRFWPASRASRPKQFMPIAGGSAMITQTVARMEEMVPIERVLVVTAAHQAEQVREALPGIPDENILREPESRNTAPCIALAALEIARRSEQAMQIVVPADQVIEPPDSFYATVKAACTEAGDGDCLITLGIKPTFPATGYGYIQAGETLRTHDGTPVLAVDRFVEKPDEETARGFIESGGYFWNAGIFAWRTDAILAALNQHFPEAIAALDNVGTGKDLDAAYAGLSSVPIDIAVMEQADNVRVIPIDYRWSDVGAWDALPEVHPPDADGNYAVLGQDGLLINEDSKGCITWTEDDSVVALIGVEDMIVVRTENALLVCPRDRAQDVKKIVEQLKQKAPRFL